MNGKRINFWFQFVLGLLVGTGWVQANDAVYVPRSEQVNGPVHAIVGPLGQRSRANAGLNANYGFVVTP